MDFTRVKRHRLAVAFFIAATVFFGVIARYAGIEHGKARAADREIALNQNETDAPQRLFTGKPIVAKNDVFSSACAEGGSLVVRADMQGDAFCHHYYGPSAVDDAIASAFDTPREEAPTVLATAMSSAIASEAFGARPQNSATPLSVALATDSGALPEATTPQSGLPDALTFGPIFSGGSGGGSQSPATPPSQEASDEPDNGAAGPDDPGPILPEPEDPPLPMEPGGPDDPIGPFDPTDPDGSGDPVAPTVVPIPGAVALWGPGLAALLLAARRKKTRKAETSGHC